MDRPGMLILQQIFIMEVNERIGSFILLGQEISAAMQGNNGEFGEILRHAEIENPWFTRDNVLRMLEWITRNMDPGILGNWLSAYNLPESGRHPIKSVGLVMAGNIPLVGFHDLLCVLLSGQKAVVKYSSKDSVLPAWLIGRLLAIDPRWAGYITVVENRLSGFDAVIATGSNNTSRAFEYYFGKYPHIFRRNRHGIAVLDGSETDADLAMLAEDVFSYFGLGCRNVSKLFLPEGFEISRLLTPFAGHEGLMMHNKYHNNYSYYKSVYLVGLNPFTDFGFLILKEDRSLSSPPGVLYFEHYSNRESLLERIGEEQENIQCMVAGRNFAPDHVHFGKTQDPQLRDYADGVDTMKFLVNLSAG
jgi:hypothetical protein